MSPTRSAYTSTPSGSVSSRRAPCRAVARLASPNRPRMAPLEEFVASRLRAWRACPVSRPFVVRPLPAVVTAIRCAILRRGIPLLVSLAPRVTTAEPRPAVSLRSTRATPAPLLIRRLKPVPHSPSLLVGFPSSGRCWEVPAPFPCTLQAKGAGEPRVTRGTTSCSLCASSGGGGRAASEERGAASVRESLHATRDLVQAWLGTRLRSACSLPYGSRTPSRGGYG